MLIQCILKRDGGSKIDLDGIAYHFEPLADGAHVADVAHDVHADRFLAIPEGYKVYRGDLTPAGKPQSIAREAGFSPSPAPAKKSGGMLYGSSEHQSQYEIGGIVYSLGDVVRKSFEASGLSEDDWNELDESDRASRIDITLDEMADAAEAAGAKADAQAESEGEEGQPAEDDERAALVEAYKAKFGKAPHYRAKIETIKAELAAE